MNKKQAIDELNDLDGDDQEFDHSRADDILLEFLRDNGCEEVAEAWDNACGRIGFWYA